MVRAKVVERERQRERERDKESKNIERKSDIRK